MELALGHQWYYIFCWCSDQFQSLFLWNSLSDSYPLSARHVGMPVSILVFVELALGLKRTPPNALSQTYVSILVFVELALGHPRIILTTSSMFCFNPCFRGTRSRTSIRFSISIHPLGFQSLFLWNSLSDFSRAEVLPEHYCVSILVFVELALGHVNEYA